MADSISPRIELFDGLFEELDDVSLRRERSTGLRSAKLTFLALKALERFRSFTSGFAKALRLTDSEGVLLLEPSSTRVIFGGDDGDELRGVEFVVEIEQDDHWERFLRFMQRYAAANGMAYGDR